MLSHAEDFYGYNEILVKPPSRYHIKSVMGYRNRRLRVSVQISGLIASVLPWVHFPSVCGMDNIFP